MPSVSRGECPECAMPIPLGKTFWGLGKSFSCRGCDAALVIEKRTAAQTVTAMGLVTVAHFVSVPLALAGGVVAQLFAWKYSRVHLERGPAV